jgi:hypothetical protein
MRRGIRKQVETKVYIVEEGAVIGRKKAEQWCSRFQGKADKTAWDGIKDLVVNASPANFQ